MSGNHDIDNFVKRKLSEREFAFDEMAWADAERLLDAQMGERKPRRRFWMFFIVFLGVSLLGAYGFGIWQNYDRSFVAPVEAIADNQAIEAKEDILLSQSNGTIAAIANAPVESAAPKASNQDQVRQPAARTNLNTALSSTSSASSLSTTAKIVEASLIPTPADRTQVATSANIPLNTLEASTLEAESINPTANQFQIDNSFAPNIYEMDVLGVRMSGQFDVQGDLRPLKNLKRIRHRIFLEAGNDVSTLDNHAPYAGLSYQYTLSPRLQVESGFRYRMQMGLDFEEIIRRRTYSFGYVQDDYTLQVDRLHLVEMPFRVNWRPLPRYSFSGGVTAGYLYSSNGTLDYKRISSLTAQTEGSQLYNHYREPFQTLQWQAEAGLMYHALPRLSVGLNARYKLNDLYQINHGPANAEKWNVGIRLRYHLWSGR